MRILSLLLLTLACCLSTTNRTFAFDDFEDGVITDWSNEGDARIIDSQGDILPIGGKRMAIITTGANSFENRTR